jgi:hypothetical protein
MKAEGGKPELCALFFVEFRIREPIQRSKNQEQSTKLRLSSFRLHPSSFNLRQLSPQSKMPGQNDESDRPTFFVSQELRVDHAPE